MNSEHASRVLGMGLLLGRIPFHQLEALGQDREQPVDAESLLQLLEAQGGLPEEVRTQLEKQVRDLEHFLEDREASGEDRDTVEMVHPPTVNLDTAEYLPESISGPEQTPPRGLWPSLPRPVSRDMEGHALLSVLTLPKWNQYVNLQFIGEGGMGRIFKAYDPTLNRVVALKFLRWVGRDSVQDLVEEARNQAKVDHPNICKVYEVREWHGQVYVAMQYIKGRTLDRVAAGLDVAQKVALMETVADAVHAAHRKGLVHRDLKPANIMVEESPDELTPYILDFGLARNQEKLSQTAQGSIIGTAHYMAPEQARGDMASIERRTDVYALGVVLYELFSGAPPFYEIQGMDCLRYICDVDVPPLGRVVPNLHKDLQTIVAKCLEKDLSQRYDSARALAEDLRRFQDGEPIHARRASWSYRFGKFARKNRVVVALAATALVGIGFFAAIGIQARVTASSQAFWAQHFGQEAERIEALLRYARLQPTHDIRQELSMAGQRIQAMESEWRRLGNTAKGPGHYALGRALLAFGDPQEALRHLEAAWTLGYQSREVAYVRGRAMGQLYERSLRKARAIEDPSLRGARIDELERTLRNPAIALMHQGQGTLLEPGPFQEGVMALYDRRFAEALSFASLAASQAPWFYEAKALQAEIHLEMARLRPEANRLAQADEALAAAIRTAPSDPDLADLESRRWREELVQRRRAGLDPLSAWNALDRSCDRWEAILPGAPGPMARRAWGAIELARCQGLSQRKNHLDQGLSRARAALALESSQDEALGALAAGLQLQAYSALDAGEDPRPLLDQAAGLLRLALAGDGASFELFEPFATTYWARIEFEKGHGIEPATTVQEAIQALQALARRYPRVPDIDGFLGGILVEWADHQATHGQDPTPAVQRALSHLNRAVAQAPNRFEFHFSSASAHLAQAQYRFLKGASAEVDLRNAEGAYRRAMEGNPAVSGPLFGLGEVGLLRAQELDRAGRSPLRLLADAEAVMADPKVRADANWRVDLFQAQAFLLRARWNDDRSAARSLLEQADRAAERAIKLSGRVPTVLWVRAQVHLDWVRQDPKGQAGRWMLAKRLLEEAQARDAAYEPVRQLLESMARKSPVP